MGAAASSQNHSERSCLQPFPESSTALQSLNSATRHRILPIWNKMFTRKWYDSSPTPPMLVLWSCLCPFMSIPSCSPFFLLFSGFIFSGFLLLFVMFHNFKKKWKLRELAIVTMLRPYTFLLLLCFTLGGKREHMFHAFFFPPFSFPKEKVNWLDCWFSSQQKNPDQGYDWYAVGNLRRGCRVVTCSSIK